MARQTVNGGFQVGEDRDWQERAWTAQRIAWVAMALFIVAAAAGVTGKGGPIASASAELAGGSIEYPRITRWQTDEQVTVRLAKTAPARVELLLSPQFVKLFGVNSIEPEPSEVRATPRGHLFTFDTEAGGERVIAFNVRAANPVLAQPIGASLGNTPPERLFVTVLP